MEIHSSTKQHALGKVHRLLPAGLTFEWMANSVIPSKAYDASGRAFTGNASVSQGIYDWSGPFLNGQPHGTFRIVVGDRSSGVVNFLHGIKQTTAV